MFDQWMLEHYPSLYYRLDLRRLRKYEKDRTSKPEKFTVEKWSKRPRPLNGAYTITSLDIPVESFTHKVWRESEYLEQSTRRIMTELRLEMKKKILFEMRKEKERNAQEI
jgi:hypothetical protein